MRVPVLVLVLVLSLRWVLVLVLVPGYTTRTMTAEHDGLRAHGATLMAGGYSVLGRVASAGAVGGGGGVSCPTDFVCWEGFR